MTNNSAGKKCLKCGYVRKESDFAPDYECPSCGAVYAKVEARRNPDAIESTSSKPPRGKSRPGKEKSKWSRVQLKYFGFPLLAASFILAAILWILSLRLVSIILAFGTLWIAFYFFSSVRFKKIHERLLVGLLAAISLLVAVLALFSWLEGSLALVAAENAGFKSVKEFEAAKRAGFDAQPEYEKYLQIRAKEQAQRQKANEQRKEQDMLAKKEERKRKEEECKKDLKCWGDRNIVSAGFLCKVPIERLAKYDYEWTDGWLEPKFSHFRWKDKNKKIITYIGDKVKFQNALGAWQRHSYECDLDTETDRVVSVRAKLGRM